MPAIGATLGHGKPFLFVMESGYAVGDLGRNVASIIGGYFDV